LAAGVVAFVRTASESLTFAEVALKQALGTPPTIEPPTGGIFSRGTNGIVISRSGGVIALAVSPDNPGWPYDTHYPSATTYPGATPETSGRLYEESPRSGRVLVGARGGTPD
jgi:hypothetical protein